MSRVLRVCGISVLILLVAAAFGCRKRTGKWYPEVAVGAEVDDPQTGETLEILPDVGDCLTLDGGGGGGGAAARYVEVHTGQDLRFTVGAQAGRGDSISLRLLNPPPGCTFTPLVNAPSPATTKVAWRIPRWMTGTQHLVFEGYVGGDPDARQRMTLHVRVVQGG